MEAARTESPRAVLDPEDIPLSPSEVKESCQREIEIEIPAGVVSQESERVLAELRKVARLPGFRKGKVPASVIRQRYASELRTEVVDSLVPRYFREEVMRQGLKPVSQPLVTDLKWEEGQPLTFKAKFEVLPVLQVEGYRELRPEKPEIEVKDEEVEQTLEHLREQHSVYDPVTEERALAQGDFALVSLNGTAQEPEAKPVEVKDVLVEIGGANTVPEFTQNLLGTRPGEARHFDVQYAEDFSDRRLAGKSVAYAVQVQGIKRKIAPQLNDEFARQAGEFQTLAELRKALRDRLEAQHRHTAEHEAKEKLVDELVRRNDFPIPESLVERQIDVRLERGLRALASQGMRPEEMKKLDWTRLRAGQREAAEKEVRASLILDSIAEQEKIEVSDEEIEREITLLAAETRQTPDAIRAQLTREGALDRIRDRLRSEKTLSFLYEQPA